MRKILSLLMITLLFVSCGSTIFNSTKEKTIEVAADTYAEAYAFVGSCARKDLIKADAIIYIPEKIKFLRLAQENNVNTISKSTKGFVQDLCLAQIDLIFPKLIDSVTKKAKPEYECTGEFVENTGIFLAKKVCEKIKI